MFLEPELKEGSKQEKTTVSPKRKSQMYVMLFSQLKMLIKLSEKMD